MAVQEEVITEIANTGAWTAGELEIEEETATEVEVLPLRERILDTRRKIETNFINFAEDLYSIWEGSNFMSWGYNSFRDYVEEELSIKYRRARYFVAIAKAVHDLQLDWKDIEAIGWTKARALLPFLRRSGISSGEELESWLDWAKEDSASELKTRMAETTTAVALAEGGSPIEEMVTYTTKFSQEQAALFNDTLDHAKRMFDVDTNADALESICYDWMMRAGSELSTMSLDSVVDWISETYGVTVTTTPNT